MNHLPRRYSTLALIVGLAVGFATLITACTSGRKPQDGDGSFPPHAADDLRRFPPGVESATLQPIDEGQRALLEVRFDKADKRVGKRISIFPEGEEVVLTDDGRQGDATANDGVPSAVVDFDVRELAEQGAAAAREMNNVQPMNVFRGRTIVGVAEANVLRAQVERVTAFRNVDKLIADKAKIDISLLFPIWSYLRIDPARSLMITDPSVVQDPNRTVDPCNPSAGAVNGKWTFKHLVTEMTAGTGVDPATFVEQWLRLWQSNQPVASGFSAVPRPQIGPAIMNAWPRVNGELDLDRAPFRLSAIVNRIDLAENLIYGPGSGSEARFVFGVRDPTSTANNCKFLPFSVIFEYRIPKSGCHELKDWARQWAALSALPIGSPQYNAALEAITEQFVKAGAAPGKPNGSALNQLRTNENALVTLWELREFRIKASTHLLSEDTVKQTPDRSLNRSVTLGNYINGNEPAILTDRHVVPNRFPGNTPFMAATSRAEGIGNTKPPQLLTHFEAPNVTNNDARFHFSLNTCTACHIQETGTVVGPPANNEFLPVDPRAMPALLSRFLTGATPDVHDFPDLFKVDDPVDGTDRHFNDLDLRRQRLAAIADAHCFNFIFVPPRALLDRIPRVGPDGRLPRIDDPRIVNARANDPIRMTH